MRKKFSICSFVIIFLNILLFSSNVFSKDKCRLYLDELKSDYEKYTPEKNPTYNLNDFGIRLEETWNYLNNETEYKRDENGYYSIGLITDPSIAEKVTIEDLIISVNGKDLRTLEIDYQDDKTLANLFSENEEVEFKFKNSNSNTYNLKLSKKVKSLFWPYTDLYIYSIYINEKTKKLTARLGFEASHSFGEDDLMYELSKKYLWFNEEDDYKETVSCYFDVYEWETELNFGHPAKVEYADLHSTNFDLFTESLTLKPYTDEIQWHKENNWDNELYVEYTNEGVHVFNTNFNYINFPFDRQKIKFEMQNFYDLSDGIIEFSNRTQKYLNKFQEKNNIAGWDIVNNKLTYDVNKNPADIYHGLSAIVEIEIERKHGYYIWKVILPIIIILIVCWSSIWVTARELESKLTITIVCLLSLIAYNFIIDGEIPKLEYLTIIDWIILASYFYAALPNILAVHFFNLYSNKRTKQLNTLENLTKRYGLVSYLAIVFSIILINVNINPEGASGLFSWLAGK